VNNTVAKGTKAPNEEALAWARGGQGLWNASRVHRSRDTPDADMVSQGWGEGYRRRGACVLISRKMLAPTAPHPCNKHLRKSTRVEISVNDPACGFCPLMESPHTMAGAHDQAKLVTSWPTHHRDRKRPGPTIPLEDKFPVT
jgi:hypothetical protein